MSGRPRTNYAEIYGPIGGAPRTLPPGDVVVLSNLHGGSNMARRGPGLGLRLVARGRETYRVDGRGMHLDEARVMITSTAADEEVEIPRRDRHGTLGLCVMLPLREEDEPWVAGPLIMSAASTPFGPLMEHHIRTFSKPIPRKEEIAASLARQLRALVPQVTSAVLEQAAAIEAAKPSTRFEMVRRAHLAQAYLHSTLDRAVALEELAREVGNSPFQLLRAFQRCFGQTPADYHRELRLNAVIDGARRRGVSLASASQDFGFADGSSFSHAYRRAFGRAPVWSKGQ